MVQKVSAKIIKSDGPKLPFRKAEIPTARQEDDKYTEILEPPYPLADLLLMREYSTILPQCIDAYRHNICGFGVALKYRGDETRSKETSEMAAEWNNVTELIKWWNLERPFKDVFGQAIEHREYCGNGYIEIIRDGRGLPASGLNVDPKYIKVTQLTDPIEVDYKREGKKFTITKRFRRYVQDINGKKIWFKQFGDPRTMDLTTGRFGENIPVEKQANEILHLKIGDSAYGLPRWIGQIIHMYGARKAEELNYRYFYQGRHIPAAIIVSNGRLTEDSQKEILEYAKGIEGVENAHKFLLIEAEGEEEGLLEDEKKGVKVELKPMAEILQQDALFLDYDEKSRQKVQSVFRLPDIYVGRTRDFNRATAEMAMEITEQQVFIPERESLQFVINNIVFYDFDLRYVDVYFKKPDISNTQDKVALLRAYKDIGGVAPNDVREEVGHLIGKNLENFQMDEANYPLALRPQQNMLALQKSLDSNIIDVLKDLRDVLEELHHGKD